jgi:hypothetical protein
MSKLRKDIHFDKINVESQKGIYNDKIIWLKYLVIETFFSVSHCNTIYFGCIQNIFALLLVIYKS